MRRTPRTPVNSRSGTEQSKRFPTAESYLVRRRGEKMAHAIIGWASMVMEVLQRPRVQLNPAERKRAVSAARFLVPLVARSYPGTGLILSLLINQWSKVRLGRPPGPQALFANGILMLCAGELGARDLPPFTATELIAAAAAGGVPGVSWADRRQLLDSWRKLHRDGLPEHPEKLIMETRARLKREEEERRPGAFNERRQLAAAEALRKHSAARP